jgi:alpha-glucosidase
MPRLSALRRATGRPCAQPVPTASSPDGKIVLTVSTKWRRAPMVADQQGQAADRAVFSGLHPDRWGEHDARLDHHRQRDHHQDDTWEQPWGERRFVRDHYRELLVHFRQDKDHHERLMNVRFRLFDNGIGFRYEIPAQAAFKTMHIADELTEFSIAPKGTAWWITGGEWNRYEQVYQKTPIDGVATAHTPVTMRLEDGTHLAIHEAALVDYSAMWLKRQDGQTFRSTLSPSSHEARVTRDLPFATPWRTMRIAPDAAGLVENDLELNLNEPSKVPDIATFFKPQKYIGIWWGMIRGDWTWATGPKHGATTERTKQYIDFAAKNGFSGVLVEGWDKGWDGTWFGDGWDFSYTQPTPDFDLKAITDYAAKSMSS